MIMNDPLKLYWWVPPGSKITFGDPSLTRSNVGDTVSRVIVEALSGRAVVHDDAPGKLLAVGSILSHAMDGDIVWGSGLPGTNPKVLPPGKNISFRAVRGPLTRDLLLKAGHACPEIYGDPALLLPRIYSPKAAKARKWGLVPHIDHITPHENLIDVRWPWQRVIDEICACEFIISSSLHGNIIAEAYGIPAIWLHAPIGRMKFDDHYALTGRSVQPARSIEEALARPLERHIPTFDLQPLLHAFPYHKMT